MVGTRLKGGSAGMMYVLFRLRNIIRITPIVVIPSQTYVYIRCEDVEFPIFKIFPKFLVPIRCKVCRLSSWVVLLMKMDALVGINISRSSVNSPMFSPYVKLLIWVVQFYHLVGG